MIRYSCKIGRVIGQASLLLVMPLTAAMAQTVPNDRAVPQWQVGLLFWKADASDPHPWRTDNRLARNNQPGFPDDFVVLFRNLDSLSGGKHEGMWVTATAHDSVSDQYLGVLLNQPNSIQNLNQFENVVFQFDSAANFPMAVDVDGRYDMIGWPVTAAPEFRQRLLIGIRAYRAGSSGHDGRGIERCINTFESIFDRASDMVSTDELFVAHFVWGRCLAERYETESAIEQFRAAVAVKPEDLDAQLALLAEYSIMTHSPDSGLRPRSAEDWDQTFVDQLDVVRTRFGHDRLVQQVMELLFDPSDIADADSTVQADMERLSRVGYSTFRWKRR